MNERVQKIKNHFSEYKVAYAIGTTAVVVSVGVTYYFTRSVATTAKAIEATAEYVGDTVVHNAPNMKQVACYKPVMNNIIEFAERSCLSKAVVRLGEDGGIEAAWASINETARNTNWSAAAISKCANGLTDNLGGERYAFLKDLIEVAS